MRILCASVCVVILTASTVSGFTTGPAISQIQEAGVKINNEFLPPQLAFYYSVNNASSGETENIQNRHSDSEESAEQNSSFVDQHGNKLCYSKQEDYKRDCFKIVPGLQIKDLIFPFHFHT